MKSATNIFLGGPKNFETFAGKNRTGRTVKYVKTLNKLSIDPSTALMPDDPLSDNFNYWQITVNSKSFVYNQVRRIVGALVSIASGVITERDAKIMLQVPNNHNWNSRVNMAPPQGLYLKQVNYDEEELNSHIIQGEKLEIIKQEILQLNEQNKLSKEIELNEEEKIQIFNN